MCIYSIVFDILQKYINLLLTLVYTKLGVPDIHLSEIFDTKK